MQRYGSSHVEDYERKHAFGPSGAGLVVLQEVSNLTVRLDSLDPVSLLKVHQLISHTTQHLRIATVPFSLQILAYQIEHCGEGAEALVLLNMEL